MNFNASGVVLTKECDGSWSEKTVELHNIDDIRRVFHPFETDVTQVNISRQLKLYYSMNFLFEGKCTEAKVKDEKGNRNFLVSPILLLECDANDVPMVLTEENKNKMLSLMERF